MTSVQKKITYMMMNMARSGKCRYGSCSPDLRDFTTVYCSSSLALRFTPMLMRLLSRNRLSRWLYRFAITEEEGSNKMRKLSQRRIPSVAPCDYACGVQYTGRGMMLGMAACMGRMVIVAGLWRG